MDRALSLAEDMEAFLRVAFEENYDLLRLEVGRSMAPNLKEAAWQEVRLYWEKLRALAESVTDTEVRLTLPNQRSPKRRPYAIDGVVDIVREVGYTVLYDIKSMDADYVRQHAEQFERQLNVYAHIWQTLRGEELNETAIVATALPHAVQDAVTSGDPGHMAHALGQWSPVVPLAFAAERVDETVEEFGRVVDDIEDGVFAPRSPEHLNTRQGATRQLFGSAVCNECDARFSCASYRQWAGGRGGRSGRFTQYFAMSEAEQEAWREANMEVTPEVAALEQDFVE